MKKDDPLGVDALTSIIDVIVKRGSMKRYLRF